MIEVQGLSSSQFTEAAARGGAGRVEALAAYRRAFREGVAAAPAGPIVLAPVVGRAEERGTVKFVMRFADGLESESVIIPGRGASGAARDTLCVSSQVGCAMGCTFCETAQMGLRRHLSAAEIVGQWFAARFVFGRVVRNVVFMGMGEPLDNLEAVLQSLDVLADQNGPAIAPSRLTISTVGRLEGIRVLARRARTPGWRRLRLAVSVNAPNDAIRSSIMPLNRAEPMAALRAALLEWPARGGARILIEYVLIPGVNDRPEHARELAAWLEPLACAVNVIPYNPRRNSPWPAPDEALIETFVDALRASGQRVFRRRTKGRSVMAACGQLGNPGLRSVVDLES